MKEKFSFLKSVRFWKLVIMGIVNALSTYGVITPEIAGSISLIILGDVTINTVDRFSTGNKK